MLDFPEGLESDFHRLAYLVYVDPNDTEFLGLCPPCVAMIRATGRVVDRNDYYGSFPKCLICEQEPSERTKRWLVDAGLLSQ